jgi:DNA-binding XRE family transcriptional regulator
MNRAQSTDSRPLLIASGSFREAGEALDEIRAFLRRHLPRTTLTSADQERTATSAAEALVKGVPADAGLRVVRLRIFDDHVELELLREDSRADVSPGAGSGPIASFAEWMSDVLKREGLSQEAAARRIGVSLKTVNRWVRGKTEPRMRELRLVNEAFGSLPPLVPVAPR